MKIPQEIMRSRPPKGVIGPKNLKERWSSDPSAKKYIEKLNSNVPIVISSNIRFKLKLKFFEFIPKIRMANA